MFTAISLVQVSFAIGAVLVNVLALVVMTSIHGDNAWRWLLGFTALPMLLLILLFPVSASCVLLSKELRIVYHYRPSLPLNVLLQY